MGEKTSETMQEVILWTKLPCLPHHLPETDTTVLLEFPDPAGEPVWPGFWDDEDRVWREVSGERCNPQPVAFAEMPIGPSGMKVIEKAHEMAAKVNGQDRPVLAIGPVKEGQ